METSQLRSVNKSVSIMVCLVVVVSLLFASKCAAEPEPEPEPGVVGSFPFCYGRCMATCVLGGGSATECAWKCLKECVFNRAMPLESDTNSYNNYFCRLGCADSLCTKISTKADPAVKKVGSCLNSCSQSCAK